MTDTTAAAGLEVQKWDSNFFKEYVSNNRFNMVMGDDENAIIQLNEDLTMGPGKSITFSLVNKLSGAGVTGDGTLEGNEEALDSRSYELVVDQIRHAVRVGNFAEQKSAIDLRKGGRAALKSWIMEKTRDEIIAALASKNGVAYGTASEAQKDAWLVDNADRVLFGAAKANNAANDHSVALATIDNTNDKLTTGAISLMKRIALSAAPKVRPMEHSEDERNFVMFANSLSFRDLKEDTTITQAQREALGRGEGNPLFRGGDLKWDGVIVKEVEDMGVFAGVGAAGIDVGAAYLCGAQALGIGWAQRTKSHNETFDYGSKTGVAISEIRGIEKLIFGSGAGDTDDTKDHGVVTGYFAAVADT